MNEKKVQKFIMVILMCTAGAVMLQLAAPMILGLIVNAVSIGIPFAVYYLLIRKKWRIRIIKSSEEKEQSGSGSGAAEEGLDDGNNGQDERTTRYMNGIHGAEGNESKRYLPIYLHMEKMNFGFVPMVSVISAIPKGLQTGWQSSWISGRASQYHYRIFKAGRILCSQ